MGRTRITIGYMSFLWRIGPMVNMSQQRLGDGNFKEGNTIYKKVR
jgi:hypothetical protein